MTNNEHRVMHGVDCDDLGVFLEHAAANPEEVQLGLGAHATYEGTCAHSLAKVDGYGFGNETIRRETREYTIQYGGWKELLDAAGWSGPTDRIGPIEAALSALAACINVGITVNAVAHGADVQALQTWVRTDVDPSVLFSLADLHEVNSVFEHLTAEIKIEGENLDADLVDEWARRAPVYTLFSLAQDIELTVNTPTELSGSN